MTFYWNGERYRPTIKIPPTASNIRYAERLKAEKLRPGSTQAFAFRLAALVWSNPNQVLPPCQSAY
ncbi:Arm DNA-binding domain-containing protein [Ferrovum myxofaciens]|uniref:Arm DNA-binding domain-containing protein n=1 Tax=Ferrovum myxofaciens TaxID=416213 RepID=UPI001D0D4ACA